MAEYFVIRLGDDAPDGVSWIVTDGNGTRLSQPGRGSLQQAALEVSERAVIALVPAAEVLTTTVNLPVRGTAKLLATLPFALEDQVAEDVEKLHFAAGTRRDDGQVPVAIVARERMDFWMETLSEAGIKPAMMVPETYGLARIPGTTSLLVAEDQVFFNDGANTEFVIQGVQPSDALAAAGALKDATGESDDDARPAPHLLVYCEPEAEQRYQHDWLALRNELPGLDMHLLPDGALPRLAVTIASGAGVNLLQGAYGATTEYRQLFQPWRGAAMLLLGLAVILLAGKGVDYYRLTREHAQLKTQFTELYRQIRPNDTREISDPIGTVSSLKLGLGGGSGPQVFLPALQELSNALGKNSAVSVEAISYRAGIIDIRVNAPDVASLDAIEKSVSANDRYEASIQSTDQVGERVNSRIQVREN
jgi:general secretion pathway protein L